MMKGAISFVFLVTTMLCFSGAEASQEIRTIQEEIKILKERQSEIQKDIRDIKSFLGNSEAQPEQKYKEAVIGIKGAPFKSNENAKIVMVEFSNFECSWCSGFVSDTFPQVENEFIKTGKVKYVFINYSPSKVAEAARCAGDQGKFWQMHARLFANQSALGPTNIMVHS
jgi:protein-disulfide isomerase